jgi:hypothetical protein
MPGRDRAISDQLSAFSFQQKKAKRKWNVLADR